MLGPSAVAGSVVAQENVVVYAMVFGGYFIARIWRAVCDRRAHIDLASTVGNQGFKTKFCPSFLFGRPWTISWAAVCISYSTNVCLIFLL